MQRNPNRMLKVWQAWFRRQWNSPSRSDYYLMQVAREVCRVLKEDPSKIQNDDFKITFEFKESLPVKTLKQLEQESKEEREASAALAKSKWLGIGKTVRKDRRP